MDCVLAMYDVRGKQNFIYKSQKIKEIIGGSKLIEDVFKDYLYPAAKMYCMQDLHLKVDEPIYDYQRHLDEENSKEFSYEKFTKRMESGRHIGEVVYEGGGNFFVLYRDAETCVNINKIFTADLLREIGTLKVLCTFVPIDDFSDFRGDQDKLYALHRIHEAQESVIYPVNTLPFVQTAPNGNRPYTGKIKMTIIKKGKKVIEDKNVTTEQKAKYKKYNDYTKKTKADQYDQEEYLLDKLVEQRGEESLLAVIYIDSNGMGAKVQACLDGDKIDGAMPKKNYDDCVTALRTFSKDIQINYVRNRRQAINAMLEKKYEKRSKEKGENKKEKVRRTIVAAGDEMTIICNARDALDVVRAYFQGMPEDGSSCVGIAIFHSHAPYADAYRIAEECCESGKKYMKTNEITNKNFIDFHFCQGSIGITLDSIRKRESGGWLYSRPWRIEKRVDENNQNRIVFSPTFNCIEQSDETGKEQVFRYTGLVDDCAEKLNKTARSNVKALRDAAQHGTGALKMELKRINAHSTKEKQLDFSRMQLSLEQKRDLINDITIVYDLWFRKEEQDVNETSEIKN